MINQSINQSINQASNQAIKQSLTQSINQSLTQSINQSSNHSLNQSINQAITQAITHSLTHSLTQSINQSINQSITSTSLWGVQDRHFVTYMFWPLQTRRVQLDMVLVDLNDIARHHWKGNRPGLWIVQHPSAAKTNWRDLTRCMHFSESWKARAFFVQKTNHLILSVNHLGMPHASRNRLIFEFCFYRWTAMRLASVPSARWAPLLTVLLALLSTNWRQRLSRLQAGTDSQMAPQRLT